MNLLIKSFTAAVSALLLFASYSQTANAQLKIETTTEDIAAITRTLGAEHVVVNSLTKGTRDPHFAVAKPSMIRRVYNADLLISIGADMEIGWLPALLQAARNDNVLPENKGYLDLSESVELLGKQHQQVTRDMGDVHAKGNPHYWLNPNNGILMAKAISKRLSLLDAENAEVYHKNLKVFVNRLQAKILDWKKTLSDLNEAELIAYHQSFIYLAAAFNFTIVDEVEPKPGISPSAKTLQNLIDKINKQSIQYLIIEPYYEKRSAEYLENKTAIKTVVLPQSVGATEKIDSYEALFDAIVQAFVQASMQSGVK